MLALRMYREDEARAMTVVEGILNRTETVIGSLFLYYVYNIYELLLFNATNSNDIMERYVSANAIAFHRLKYNTLE